MSPPFSLKHDQNNVVAAKVSLAANLFAFLYATAGTRKVRELEKKRFFYIILHIGNGKSKTHFHLIYLLIDVRDNKCLSVS